MKSNAVQQEPTQRNHACGKGGMARKLMSALALCLTLALTGEDVAAVTLGELVKQAAFNNPAALSRQRAVESAGESVSSARWQFFPNPSISVERASSRNSRDVSYGGDSSVVTLRLQQTLWAGGRLTAQLV